MLRVSALGRSVGISKDGLTGKRSWKGPKPVIRIVTFLLARGDGVIVVDDRVGGGGAGGGGGVVEPFIVVKAGN